MKYVFQFCRILLVCLLGEVLANILPLPVPASVYVGFQQLPLLVEWNR